MKITLADLKNRALIVSLIPINRQMICERDWQRATVAPAMRRDATWLDVQISKTWKWRWGGSVIWLHAFPTALRMRKATAAAAAAADGDDDDASRRDVGNFRCRLKFMQF